MALNGIATQFYNAGLNYSTAIEPYALKLFFALFLIDIIVTWIQYAAEGQLDPSYFLGRMLKHILTGGFIYLMIVNAFPWMNAIIKSFSTIGASISGLPNLSPQSVLALGDNMARMIFDTPANASLMSNLEIAIVQSVCGFFVLLAFTITAAALLFTLVEAYLAVGGGVLLLAFGGSRFTASAAEGYFPFVIRVGVRILFFYLVLGVGVQLANQWNAAMTAACNPVSAAVPWIHSYYVPPSKVMTTVCSGSISAADMLDFAGLSVVFAIMTIGIPHTVSSLVGGSIGLALAHAFEAAYIARTIVSPITSGLKKIHDGISGSAKGSSAGADDSVQSATQDILRQHQRQSSADASTSAATKVLNPFNGQPPGYNYRPPDSSNPRGPQLPPPPNNGSGSGGASLEYHPGKPGQYTRDIAVDVTGIQNGNGKGVS
ncbi:MAG: type IV secretion system protein [Deltaproteobacteria bacterium]|nr:type IV secretion system protein [Deltaproteobacteria bacterium]